MATEMITVYRLEGKDGRGVYTGDHAYNAGVSGGEEDNRPMPWMDGISGIRLSHRFGFQSVKQLKAWFNKPYERVDLADVGVQIKVYQVSKGRVVIGGKQLTFNKSKAKLIGIQSLREI